MGDFSDAKAIKKFSDLPDDQARSDGLKIAVSPCASDEGFRLSRT